MRLHGEAPRRPQRIPAPAGATGSPAPRYRLRRALHRDVDFHVDVDSQGGEIFATIEIGRIMRTEGASIAVGTGASCLSACVFLLMGAIERTISGDPRVVIHRPSLRAPQEGGPRQGSEDAIVAALAEQLVLYAQQVHVPRTIIDALMGPEQRWHAAEAQAFDTSHLPIEWA